MLPILLAQATDAASSTAADLSQSSADLAQAQANLAKASSGAVAGAGLVWGGLMIFWGIVGLFYLIFFIWWIVLIVDLTKRDFPQKNTYMILMILALIFGFVWIMDLIYYFVIVKKGVGKGGSSAPAAPAAK